MSDKRDDVEQSAETGVPQQALDAYTGLLEGHTSSVSSIAFSVDGRRLASTSDDTTVRIWDTATGVLEQTLDGYADWVRSVAFLPDNRRLVLASGKTVWIWDIVTDMLKQTLDGHTGWVRSVALSPDGRWFASASEDWTVRVWDAAADTLQHTLGQLSSVTSVAFSPDSHQLASASDDKTVRIWDTATGVLEQTLNGHTGWVRSVAFSLDGRWLASGSTDKTVRVWDAKSGELFRELQYYGAVPSVAFSPDGRWLASASEKAVLIWDTATGERKQTLNGHTDWVRSVAFSPDGRWFASASDDRTVRIWDTATDTSRIKSVFFPGRIGKLCKTCKSLHAGTAQISLEHLKLQSQKQWSCQMCAVFWRCLEALLGAETPRLYATLIFQRRGGEQRGPLRADLIPHHPDRVRKIRLQFYPDIGTILDSWLAVSMFNTTAYCFPTDTKQAILFHGEVLEAPFRSLTALSLKDA